MCRITVVGTDKDKRSAIIAAVVGLQTLRTVSQHGRRRACSHHNYGTTEHATLATLEWAKAADGGTVARVASASAVIAIRCVCPPFGLGVYCLFMQSRRYRCV